MSEAFIDGIFGQLRLSVLERGWLSSNNVVLRPPNEGPVTVVDSGYVAHESQTTQLVEAVAGTAGVELVVNTHLHSDHCGGNAALQDRWACEAWVPEVSLDAVRSWDASRLSFEATDQRCRRFSGGRGMAVGESLQLAGETWQALHAPGHDPDALMLWHAPSRVLIAGDALWESRLAIVFPELDGRSGFAEVRQVLDAIEALDPAVVVPGHGAAFADVSGALRRSRQRLAQFEADPVKHLVHAARALTMFHMLECRRKSRVELEQWLVRTPVFGSVMRRLGGDDPETAARDLVARLQADALLRDTGDGILAVD